MNGHPQGADAVAPPYGSCELPNHRSSTMKPPIGNRGTWFATVAGERLPCVFTDRWTARDRYHDPSCRDEPKPQDRKYVEELKSKRRVLLTVAPVDDKGVRQRNRYVCILVIDNVSHSNTDGLRFRIVNRETW